MEWIKIFPTEQEACERIEQGRPQLLVINTSRICLVRFEHSFFAVQDSCTHNGESLSKGKLNYLGEIICPWHNYCFNLQSGRELEGRSADLRTYPLKINADGFFIGV